MMKGDTQHWMVIIDLLLRLFGKGFGTILDIAMWVRAFGDR